MLCLQRKCGSGMPSLWIWYGSRLLEVLIGKSKVFVFNFPETHMSVYFQLDSVLYLVLCRYEGIRVKICNPGCCAYTENVVPGLPVFDYDVCPRCLKFCLGPPKFWYLLSLRPIRVYIPKYIVVCTLGCYQGIWFKMYKRGAKYSWVCKRFLIEII